MNLHILILFIFYKFIDYYPKLSKYKKQTRLSIYRSLMCIYFTFYATEIVINYNKKGFNNLLEYCNKHIKNISDVFISYIVLDLLIMIYYNNKRVDLYIHHLWCLLCFIIAKSYNRCSYLFVILLINESISIVSGIDSIFMEEKQYKNSMYCKKYRKYIIDYIRFPIWIFVLFTTIHNYDKLEAPILFIGFITPMIMLYLDNYWRNKCIKTINKYI